MVCLFKYQPFPVVAAMQLFLYCHISRTESVDKTTIITNIGDSVTIVCNISRSSIRRWNYDDDTTIFFNLQRTFQGFGETISLNENSYALTINSVGVSHEGKYTCKENNTERNVTSLYVQVPPVVTIKDMAYRFNSSSIISDPIYVDINERFTAECYADAKSEVNLKWTINDEVVQALSTNIITPYNYSRSTAVINTTLSKDQGEITCTNSGRINVSLDEINVTIPYNTYALPKLTLFFGGFQERHDSLYVNLNQVVEVTCSSSGGRPPPTLSWLVNGVNYTHKSEKCKDTKKTKEVTSCIQYHPKSFRGNITCVAVLGNTNIAARVEQTLHVYVCPNMNLMINGEETDMDVVIDRDNYTTARCRVQDPSTNFNLSWHYEHSQVKVLRELEIEGDKQIELHFHLLNPRVNITCMYTGDYSCQVQRDVTLITTTGILDAILQSPFSYLVLITTIVIVIGLVVILRFKFKGSRQKALTETLNVHQPMLSRALPSIHVNDDVVENVSNSFQEKFTVLNNDYATGTLNRSDVQLSCQLPGEGTMKYWLASTTTNGTKEETKLIAKTLSEDARMKEVMNFRSLAENLMSLKKHESIVEVLGVALDNVPYYIYQEYITCGTLKDYLLRNYQQSGDSVESERSPTQSDHKTIQLTAVTLDICEGMLFLANQRYRHPALTTRKVLLTSTGRCKLYDFWPEDLAQDRMKNLLQMKIPPLAWLAPESVFLGQYLEKSDVWNFGVVAWEVYSLGDTPFGGLTCSEIESKLRAKEDLNQPLTCPGGLFGVLLSTWNSSADERPSFENLQRKLSHFLTEMEQTSEEVRKEEQPNYFTLAKGEDVDYDDYIES